MNVGTLDKRNNQVALYWSFSLTSPGMFPTDNDSSYFVEGFDQSISWLELNHVNFSPVSFYRPMNQNQFILQIDQKYLGRCKYLLIN